MLVQKLEIRSPYKFLSTYSTIYIWCSDGWMYNTKTRIRRKITLQDTMLNMISEPYKSTSYSDVQYTETVDVFILSEKPLKWVEKGETYEDMFEEIL